ncbi:MAG: peptidylprolyl isomerase [Bacteroidetes bacterium]|nr:peptidylprolyl isomerase [Bacteroidota bacterium]
MNKFLSFSIFLFGLVSLQSCIPDPVSTDEQRAKDIKKIEQYLEDNNLVAQSTASGLHYIIEEPGTGGNPNINSQVTVKYKGYLLSGDVFDETGDTPVTFALKNLILGWQEGIPLLQKGGKGTFFLTSELGYGRNGAGSIPGNSPLIFEIELVNF